MYRESSYLCRRFVGKGIFPGLSHAGSVLEDSR